MKKVPEQFNLGEELQKILSNNVPSVAPTEDTSDILNRKLNEASVELLMNDISRYGAGAYQHCFLYLAITIHRLSIDPEQAIDSLLGNMRNSLREAYGVT